MCCNTLDWAVAMFLNIYVPIGYEFSPFYEAIEPNVRTIATITNILTITNTTNRFI